MICENDPQNRPVQLIPDLTYVLEEVLDGFLVQENSTETKIAGVQENCVDREIT